MERNLVYDGKIYDGFTITEHGEIKNLSTGHVYKNIIHKSGYCIVYLPMGKRGSVKAIRVHKAVAETFIPNPHSLPIVHHKDNDKSNPDWTNLEWVTSKENTEHWHDELRKTKEFFNNRKLSNEDIKAIKSYANMKIPYSKIANMFNVSKTVISNLLNGKSYKEMSFE